MLTQKPFRYLSAGAVASLFILAFLFYTRQSGSSVNRYILKPQHPPQCAPTTPQNHTWEFIVERDGQNYGLSDEQCRSAFPKLFVETDKSTLFRKGSPITFKELDSQEVKDAMVRGIIDQGELYIVEYAAQPVTASRARATLNALQRALTSIPDHNLLPSIEFIFTTEDFVDQASEGPIWSYSKRDEQDSVWLMPDFGYWAWPEVQVGPYQEVRRRIAAIDLGETMPDGTVAPGLQFKDKKKQLVWRGSLATNPTIRNRLLESSLGNSWASVRVIDWDDENDIRFNLLPIEDHCRYMFVAHTEGRSFSGRGKYLLNCHSVMISHPLQWKEAHHAALVSSGSEANYIEVDEKFSDLERKLNFLIDNPTVAERIADNAVSTFRDRYLTPAAEACYWRYLIRQYASVCDFEPVLFSTKDGKKVARGVPFETWLLTM